METCDRNGNCINDAPTYAQEQLADIERREAVNHPSYYKRGGVEAIDAIEAWGLGFHLGNVVKYIALDGCRIAGIDKTNPRVEITIEAMELDPDNETDPYLIRLAKSWMEQGLFSAKKGGNSLD